jgi:hypothetical protein
MSQPFADALNWVPKSRTLATTLSRAHDFARAHGHATVGLEHLLLSLIEDPDASSVLTASSVELEGLSADVAAHLATLSSEDGVLPVADDALLRILEYAVAAAQQSRRREVNGGIVLAAIVGEGNSEAAAILRNHGMTFAAAIDAIRGSTKPAASAAPGGPGPSLPRPASRGPRPEEISEAATETTEAILARARKRVDSQIKPAVPVKPPLPAAAGAATEDRSTTASDATAASKPPAAASDAGKTAAHEPVATDPKSGPPPLPSNPPSLPPETPRSASTWLPPSPPGSGAAAGHVQSRAPPPMPPLEARHQNGADMGRAAPAAFPADGSAHIGDGPRPAGEVPWPDSVLDPAAGGPPPLPKASGRRSLTADLEQVAASIARDAEARPRKRNRDLVAAEARDRRLGRPFTLDQAAATVPNRMRVGVPLTVAVSIPLVQLAALGGAPSAGKAVTLRIFAPAGAAHIEPTSPETYWLDAGPAGIDEEDASWSWTITPRRRGRTNLHLVALVRHFSRSGAGSEIELPEHIVNVRVARNYKSIIGWLLTVGSAAAVGSFFDDMAQPATNSAITWLRQTMGLP